MPRFIMLIALSALLLASSGCVSVQAPQQKPFTGFPHRHNGFDFRKAWKASPTPQGLAVQGVLKNVRYYRVEDLMMTISLLKNDEKIVAEETTYLSGALNRYEYRDFSIVLKNVSMSHPTGA